MIGFLLDVAQLFLWWWLLGCLFIGLAAIIDLLAER